MAIQTRLVRLRQWVFSYQLWLIAAVLLSFPPLSYSETDLTLLKSIIIDHNRKLIKASLADGSYRGEVGVLRIGPEVGQSLGLKVHLDGDYFHAQRLYKEADILLGQIYGLLRAKKKGKNNREVISRIADSAFLRTRKTLAARKAMAVYQSRISADFDERLQDESCSILMGELLAECLAKANGNLREALGFFYNRCEDLDMGKAALNTKNIRFVNHVFDSFVKFASDQQAGRFDLDRLDGDFLQDAKYGWKEVASRNGFPYVGILEKVIAKQKASCGFLDPLLFIALMRQESKFRVRAVSHVGAAGLTQIMPGTGKVLGMANIYAPTYFDEATELLRRERQLKNEAMEIIMAIGKLGMRNHASRAWELMQKSKVLARKRIRMFNRYRDEIVKNGEDDRLRVDQAMKFGLKYFCEMMKRQNGDMSLALASYNAGPHRVEQYEGIPPFSETVAFRNAVLNFYRGYLRETVK
jgi:hypothetical protein